MGERIGRTMTYADINKWRKEHDALVKRHVYKQAKSKKTFLVMHGGKSLNKQLPSHLDRPSNDYDAWAKQPRQRMDQMEDTLDKAVGSDMFYEQETVLAGTNKKVYRVFSRITNDAVVDYIKAPNKKGYYKIIGGIRWETLEHAKKVYEKILKDPATSMQRKNKSRKDLNRILAFEGKLESANNHGGMFQTKFKFEPYKFKPMKWR